MKRSVVLCILLSVAYAKAEVLLSNPGEVPSEGVVVSQLNSAGANQQARNLATNDWRGISQTFQWTSSGDLDGIGLHFASQQGDFAWEPTSTQTYVLVIQKVEANLPVATITQVEFELAGGNVAANQWLYMDIDDLNLDNGTWYAFTLCPASNSISSLRTFWDMADGGGYYGGRGAQWNPTISGLPKTDLYGDQGDFTFYLLEAKTVVLSNPSDVPAGNVAVSQLNSAGSNQQARNRMGDLSDWRGISQTFQWTTTNKLDAVGLHLASQQADFAWASTTTQTYVLVVQEVLEGNVPGATIAQIKFDLTDDKVAANQWLQIDLANDLALAEHQWYGLTLCPASNAVNGALRTFWDTADSESYYGGRGAQWDPTVSGLPKTDAYGTANTDFAFYLLNVAGETTPATIVSWSSIPGNVMEMVVNIPGTPSNYYPKSSADLAIGTWANVAHSVDGNEPFVITNLDYSVADASGTNRVIYVQSGDSTGFFSIVGDQ